MCEDIFVEIWWDCKVYVPDGRIVENRSDLVVDRECKEWFLEFAVPSNGYVVRNWGGGAPQAPPPQFSADPFL